MKSTRSLRFRTRNKPNNKITQTLKQMSSTGVESRIYWCHECDMSISLLRCPSSPSPALCPHCHSDFLEQMDSLPSSSSPEGLDSPYLHRLIHHLTDSPATPPRGPFSASAAAVSAIPTVPVTPSMLDADPVLLCAVCKDQFAVGAEAKQLPCSHLYHADCILPWLSLHNSCPLCRFCLPTEDDSARQREMMESAGVRFGEMAASDDWFGFQDTLRHIERRQRQVFPVRRVGVDSLVPVETASGVQTVSSWPVHGRVTLSGGGGGSDVEEEDDDDYEEVEGDMGLDECVVIMDGDAVMSEVQVSTASASVNEVINV